VTSVAFSPGGGEVFSGSPDKSLRIWNADRDVAMVPSATTKHFQRSAELLIADLHLSALVGSEQPLAGSLGGEDGQPFEPARDRIKDKDR